MTPKEKAHRVKVAVKRRESQWRVSPRKRSLESGSDIPNTGNRARESSEEIVEKLTHPLQALRYVQNDVNLVYTSIKNEIRLIYMNTLWL